MKKVIVIGAGHGGLAAAARLCVKGFDVEIFESGSLPVTIEQPLTLLAAYRDLFIKTGSQLEENIEISEVGFQIEFETSENKYLRIPGSGVGRVLAEIETVLGKSAADSWRKYTSELGNLWQQIRSELLESQSTRTLWQIVGMKNLAKFWSYQNLVKKNLGSPDLKNLASQYRKAVNLDANSKLGLAALNSYVYQTFGVYQPVLGLSALTDCLHNRCLELGVKFNFNKSASAVSLDDQIVGVQLDSQNNEPGKFIASDFVIVNDLTTSSISKSWADQTGQVTPINSLYLIDEYSWLGLGQAHAVMSAENVAKTIGSAAN